MQLNMFSAELVETGQNHWDEATWAVSLTFGEHEIARLRVEEVGWMDETRKEIAVRDALRQFFINLGKAVSAATYKEGA